MVVKKSVISKVNRKIISKIKELIIIHYKQTKVDRTFLVCEEHIYGKRKVRFKLVYNQNTSINSYSISGEYILDNRISYITVYLGVSHTFDFSLFSELYFNVKGVLYHEIEHHLQRLKVPFREKLTAFDDSSKEYVESPSELEAYLKELHFISRNTGVSLTDMICSTSDMLDNDMKELFIIRMFEFIEKRKDLNIKITK